MKQPFSSLFDGIYPHIECWPEEDSDYGIRIVDATKYTKEQAKEFSDYYDDTDCPLELITLQHARYGFWGEGYNGWSVSEGRAKTRGSKPVWFIDGYELARHMQKK